MANIKTKDIVNKGIKTFNKEVALTKGVKDSIGRTKEKVEESVKSDTNINEYGSNKIKFATKKSIDKTVNQFNKNGHKSLINTKENIQKLKPKIKSFNNIIQNKKIGKLTFKNAIKIRDKSAKVHEKFVQEPIRSSQRGLKLARAVAKKTSRTTKKVAKSTISAIKGIIAAAKGIMFAIMAGGWLAMIVIVIICLIGLIFSSIFGIFFSSEKTSSNSITMKDVIAECNQEFYDRIHSIQNQNSYDQYVLNGTMASWKDILIIYVVKQTNGLGNQEVITLDNNKKMLVKQIFWEMNSLSCEVKTEIVTDRGINTEEMPKAVKKEYCI